MKITKPGIYRDVATADYFADPCPAPSLTQSLIKTLLDRSPAHARLEHPRLAPPQTADEPAEKYVAAQAIGNAAHAIMIGRGKDIAVCAFDSWRSDKAKAERAAAESAGRMPILDKHYSRAVDMVAAGRLQLGRAGLTSAFFDGDGEVVLAWEEEGLWFRSLVDWLEPDLCLAWDYKTSGMSVAPHAIPPLLANAGWDIQAAMQERGLAALNGASRYCRFRFVAQENDPPYALTVCELPESVMTMGRKKIEMAIGIWRRCMERDEWPAYPPEIAYPELPGWHEARWLEREIHDEARQRMPSREPMLTDLSGG